MAKIIPDLLLVKKEIGRVAQEPAQMFADKGVSEQYECEDRKIIDGKDPQRPSGDKVPQDRHFLFAFLIRIQQNGGDQKTAKHKKQVDTKLWIGDETIKDPGAGNSQLFRESPVPQKDNGYSKCP